MTLTAPLPAAEDVERATPLTSDEMMTAAAYVHG
jgi:hypothetical protein